MNSFRLLCKNAKGFEHMAFVKLKNDEFSKYFDDSIIIDDYSKDPSIVNTIEYSTDFLPVSELDTTEIIKFNTYLIHKRKCGIVHGKNCIVYILPPKSPNQCFLSCLLKIDEITKPKDQISLNAMIKISSEKVKPSDPKTLLLQHVKEVEDKLRQDLQIFEYDTNFNCLALPPMSEDDRYIIHDVVFAEYPDLIASSVGEESERHILVYRKSYQPEEVTVSNLPKWDGKPIKSLAFSLGKKKASEPIPSLPKGINLIPINVKKRDRRSEEDILKEIRNKKLNKLSTDNNHENTEKQL